MHNLRLSDAKVSFFGVGGASVRGPKSIISKLHGWLSASTWKVVFLQLGNNDLCSPHCQPEQLSSDIVAPAKFILSGYSVQRVVIGQVHGRLACSYGFNEKVRNTNKLLRMAVADHSDVFFASIRGLTHPYSAHFSRDGVHFNTFGNKKYFNGVRGAILRALKN